jgi:MFS family permease
MASPAPEPAPPARALGRDAKLLLVAFSAIGAPIGLLSVAMPVYIARLGLGPVLAGTFFTTIGLSAVALVIPCGIFADRYGRRRLFLLGAALLVVALSAIALADSPAFLLAAGALLGVSEALGFSTFNALLAEASDPSRRTSVFGLSFFFNGLAFAGGSLLAIVPDLTLAGGATDIRGAYAPALWVGAAVSVAGLAAASLIRVGGPRPREGKSLLPRKSAKILAKFFVSNFIIGLGAGLIIPLFSLWFFLKFGLAETATGPLLAVASVGVAAAYLAAPAISRRYGMVRSIVALQVAATLVLFFIPIVPNVYIVGILFVVRNLLMNMSWPVASSFLMTVVDESERASASAVTGAAFRLPFAVSTTIGGFLLTVDVDLPFFVTTALYATGVATFFAFFRNVKAPHDDAGRSL